MNMIVVAAVVVVLLSLAWFFYSILRTDWMDEWVLEVISKNQEMHTEKSEQKEGYEK